MTIEIKWKDGETVKTSTISNDKILSTKMVSGKNQPFGAVEATFDRYIFSSEYKDDNWDSTSNPLPNITLGESKMSVDTFGSVTDYIITSVSNDEDYTVVTAHHPAYTLTHTYFNSLFLNIYTVYQTFDNYTKFSVNLPGWSDATFTSDAPNDWYRAQSNKGCSYKYSSTLSGSGHPGSYYETPQKMYNISRYASGVGYYGGKEGYEEVAKKKHTVWYTYRDINLILHISVETVGGKNIRSIEWVEGETEDIVRFIIMMGVSDDVYPQTFSPPMTYYPDFDLDTGLIGADPKKEYTENELNKAMSKGLVNLNQESYASYDFGTSIGSGLSTSRIRLRVNGTSTCKSILDAIGSFTNRKYHFSSEGFFMTNNVPNSDAKQYFVKDGTFGHKKVTINTHKVVYLDMDTSSEYKGVEAEMTSTAPDIIDNTDAVVISSQTVYGENYSWKTSNISSSASKEGSKILFPIVDMSDDNTEGINSYRNRMLGLCAYNELVNRYRYENSIVYTTSEIDAVPKIEGGTPIGDYDEFLRETGQLYVSGDTSTHPTGNYSIGDTILFDDGIVMEKVKKDGTGIRDWVETDLYELSSSYKYSADSCTKLLKDNYNGFELNNVPLAFLIRSYPEHLTTLAWGKSHTNDLPEQLREQQEDIMINGSPGDEDAEISNKYSSRLVVGNLTQSQLAEQDDVKNGFTGLIMEKNVGAELYRLSGYDDGILQAEFDTRGRISAGGGGVILDKDGLNAGYGGVNLDNEGLTINYDPANENFIQRNALRFRRSDIDFDTFRIYSRKYNQELDGGSSQPLQRGVANIITCETPEYRLVLSLPSTGTSGEIVEYNNNFYIWKGGWQLLGDIESLDNYIRIYTKPGYYSIINKSVTMRDTESSSDTNFKPGINTSSISYNYNNGNLLSTNHAYVSYGSMSSSDTIFPPNNYNPADGDGDKFVVTRYSFGTAGTPPRVDLPGQGDRSISFDIQVSSGNSDKDFTEVYVEYYPWEYVMGSDGIWKYKRADTPYRTRAQTFNRTGGTRYNVTFPLTHLYTTGYHDISIVVRGRWTDTEGFIYSPNFSMRKLRMNFTDEGEGGEVRLRNDCTKLYGNTSIVGTLDGTFSTTSLFKESLKRAITPLLTGVKSKPIMLSGKDGFLSRTPSYSMNVIGNTWYAPLSGGASSIVMFVMDNNVQDYDAYISRITNYGEMTTSTEIHVASHHGKSTLGGAGRSSGTILVPEGWGFKISRGTKVTIFGLTITDETV